MLYELLQKKDRIRNLKHVVTNCLSSKVATTLLTRTITCISPIITKCKKKKTWNLRTNRLEILD